MLEIAGEGNIGNKEALLLLKRRFGQKK